jgi:hypothetical protein
LLNKHTFFNDYQFSLDTFMNILKNVCRNTSAVLASIFLLSACSTSEPGTLAVAAPATMPALAPLPAIVTAYSEAWTRLDGEKVMATFSPDGVYIDPQVPKGLTGNAIASHVNSYKDIVVKIGTHRFLPDGRPETSWEVFDQKGVLLAKGHDHFTIANGKIIRMEAFFDAM